MKRFVRENLYEDVDDTEDTWEKSEEEDEVDAEDLEVDTSDMEADEIEVDDISPSEIKDMLNIELSLKDFNRAIHKYRNRKTWETFSGAVMAKLKDDNYVFKLDDGSMRKFNVNDLSVLDLEEDEELNESRGDYSYNDYLFDIAGFLMLSPENVQAILDIHHVVDEEGTKIDITNELEDNDEIYGTKGMYAAGLEPELAAEKIVNQYQE